MSEYNTFVFETSPDTYVWVENEDDAIVEFNDINNTRVYYVECVDGHNIRAKIIGGEVFEAERFGTIAWEPEQTSHIVSWKRIV